jgi:protein arginine kinase activator
MEKRPLECSDCRKPAKVCYTEVVGTKKERCMMCADCPRLEKRLYGQGIISSVGPAQKVTTSLACGYCGTTLDTFKMGNFLGCSECFSVFGDLIVDELIKAGSISRHLTSNHRTEPLHRGRSPGQTTEVSPTLKLIALNEALDETLVREDYEQAAQLRDQIEQLKKSSDNEA